MPEGISLLSKDFKKIITVKKEIKGNDFALSPFH